MDCTKYWHLHSIRTFFFCQMKGTPQMDKHTFWEAVRKGDKEK